MQTRKLRLNLNAGTNFLGQMGYSMELGRWSLDRMARISERYRGLKEFLADVLEGDRSLVDGSWRNHADAKPDVLFQVEDNVERLRYAVPLGKVARERQGCEVFKALAPFFDAGFFLEEETRGSEQKIVLKSMFLLGKTFFPAQDDVPEVEIPLPDFQDERVYRLSALPVLRLFRLEALKHLASAGAFVFSPQPGSRFLLICNRPGPWQALMLEKTQQTVSELLSGGGRS